MADGAKLSCVVTQAKGKLQPSMTGGAADVFARILRGLAGAKLTRPGSFRSQDNSMAVRCSYKVRLL